MSSEAAREAATAAAQEYLRHAHRQYPPGGRTADSSAENWLRQTYADELRVYRETFLSVCDATWAEAYAAYRERQQALCATERVDHPAGCRCDHCTGECEHREGED